MSNLKLKVNHKIETFFNILSIYCDPHINN